VLGGHQEMSRLEAMKFIVDTPEKSRDVQEVLFKLGYNWGGQGQDVKYTDHKYLHAESNGRLLHGDHERSFIDSLSRMRTMQYILEKLIDKEEAERPSEITEFEISYRRKFGRPAWEGDAYRPDYVFYLEKELLGFMESVVQED
jgi:hypothetical protein